MYRLPENGRIRAQTNEDDHFRAFPLQTNELGGHVLCFLIVTLRRDSRARLDAKHAFLDELSPSLP